MPRGTTLRNIRVNDELWTAAQEAATETGTTVSDIVREALTKYVTKHHRQTR